MAKKVASPTPTNASSVFHGSNPGDTRRFLRELAKHGPEGRIAAALFRVQKPSSLAKKYCGGFTSRTGRRIDYSDVAYRNKQSALEELCDCLDENSCGFTWGWGSDPNQPVAPHVLYVDLPIGQVSFHSPTLLKGPPYHGTWNPLSVSQWAIFTFCDQLLAQ